MQAFLEPRQRLADFLVAFIEEKRQLLCPSHPWGEDVFTRLKTFVPAGKLLRGLLVLGSFNSVQAEAHSSLSEAEVMKAASAIELFNSGVLIHDDIIDQDRTRRGQPSFFAQYEELAQQRNYAQPEHIGQSLALCVGDICLFLASEILADINTDPATLKKIQRTFMHDVTQTGLAEMDDLRLALTKDPVTEEEILSMYIFKTARYSCSLPMVMGALLAGAQPEVISQFDELGETLGLLFQMKDDEIGLFGSEAETGKPATSDVREGKKTLYYYHVLRLATESDKGELLGYFGNPSVTPDQLQRVRNVVESSGARSQVNQQMSELEAKAKQAVKALPISSTWQQTWLDFIEFGTRRQK